jgi:hypothetical protein
VTNTTPDSVPYSRLVQPVCASLRGWSMVATLAGSRANDRGSYGGLGFRRTPSDGVQVCAILRGPSCRRWEVQVSSCVSTSRRNDVMSVGAFPLVSALRVGIRREVEAVMRASVGDLWGMPGVMCLMRDRGSCVR